MCHQLVLVGEKTGKKTIKILEFVCSENSYLLISSIFVLRPSLESYTGCLITNCFLGCREKWKENYEDFRV